MLEVGVTTPDAAPAADGGRRDPLAWVPYWPVAGVLVGLGALLRIRQWAFGRGFWGDELFVAHNLRERDLVGLLHPLAYSQSAPPGWLWLERVAMYVFGPGEQGLRLVPLFFGLALLPLVAYLGWRLLPRPVGLAAVLLVAVSPFLIAYSNELKQYSAEAFWVTLLVGLALLLARQPFSWRTGLIFWGTALVAATMSTLSIPVAAVLGGLLAIRARRPWSALGRFVAPAAAWGVVVLMIYVWSLRPTQNDAALRAYWLRRQIYPSEPLTDLPATVDWLWTTVRSLALMPFSVWSAWVLLLAVAAGTVLCRRHLGLLGTVMLLTPVAVGLGASAVSAYPMIERLALYAVPCCLIVAGFLAAPGRGGLVRAALGWAAIFALAVPQIVKDADATVHPETAFKQGGGATNADYRGALRHLGEQWRPGDLVIGTPVSWYSQSYYGPPADGYAVPAGPDGCAGRTAAELLAGRSRVWLYQATDWGEPENALITERIGRGGSVSERLFRGARVVLVERPATATDVCLVSPPRRATVR